MDRKFNISLQDIISIVSLIGVVIGVYIAITRDISNLELNLKHEIITRETHQNWVKDSMSRLERKIDYIMTRNKPKDYNDNNDNSDNQGLP